MINCGVELHIHSQILTLLSLKFSKRYVISTHILHGVQFFIHAEIQTISVKGAPGQNKLTLYLLLVV